VSFQARRKGETLRQRRRDKIEAKKRGDRGGAASEEEKGAAHTTGEKSDIDPLLGKERFRGGKMRGGDR